jgi:hypothetical protein
MIIARRFNAGSLDVAGISPEGTAEITYYLHALATVMAPNTQEESTAKSDMGLFNRPFGTLIQLPNRNPALKRRAIIGSSLRDSRAATSWLNQSATRTR